MGSSASCPRLLADSGVVWKVVAQDSTNRCVSQLVDIGDDFEPFFMLNFQGHVAILQQNLPPRHGGFLCNFKKFFHWYIHYRAGVRCAHPLRARVRKNEHALHLTGKSAAGETIPGSQDQQNTHGATVVCGDQR